MFLCTEFVPVSELSGFRGCAPRRRGSGKRRRRLEPAQAQPSLKTVHRTVFACVAGRSLRGRLSPHFLQK